MTARRTIFPACDCGQPAYKRDGSGWFCQACEIAVKTALRRLDEWITYSRAKDRFANGETQGYRELNGEQRRERTDYMRDYRDKNRRKLVAYSKRYNKQHAHMR